MQQDTESSQAGHDARTPAALYTPAPLLTEAAFRALLGGMSERKFKALRAAGVIGDPLELGPRIARWTHGDYQDTMARLTRRPKTPEPATLASARRARIEAMKRQPAGRNK